MVIIRGHFQDKFWVSRVSRVSRLDLLLVSVSRLGKGPRLANPSLRPLAIEAFAGANRASGGFFIEVGIGPAPLEVI